MIKSDLDQELATKSPRVNNDHKQHKYGAFQTSPG